MSEKGENIVKAFKFIQRFYKEVSQLLRKLDDLMEENGWTSAKGNTTTSEVSKDLQKPEKWLPDGSFRLFENEKFPHIRKGIVINYVFEDRIKEPILILGRVKYKTLEKAQDWDIWNLWFDDRKERVLYKDYLESKPENKMWYLEKGVIDEASLYAMNLLDLANEEDIKDKIFQKLSEL